LFILSKALGLSALKECKIEERERNTPPHQVQRCVEDIDLTALLLLVAGA
jgi:hypothetical protein